MRRRTTGQSRATFGMSATLGPPTFSPLAEPAPCPPSHALGEWRAPVAPSRDAEHGLAERRRRVDPRLLVAANAHLPPAQPLQRLRRVEQAPERSVFRDISLGGGTDLVRAFKGDLIRLSISDATGLGCITPHVLQCSGRSPWEGCRSLESAPGALGSAQGPWNRRQVRRSASLPHREAGCRRTTSPKTVWRDWP